jgi:hypothetical protein
MPKAFPMFTSADRMCVTAFSAVWYCFNSADASAGGNWDSGEPGMMDGAGCGVVGTLDVPPPPPDTPPAPLAADTARVPGAASPAATVLGWEEGAGAAPTPVAEAAAAVAMDVVTAPMADTAAAVASTAAIMVAALTAAAVVAAAVASPPPRAPRGCRMDASTSVALRVDDPPPVAPTPLVARRARGGSPSVAYAPPGTAPAA